MIEEQFIYYVFLTWLIISWFGVKLMQNKIQKQIYFIFNYSLLFFLSAFRTKHVGADTETYLYAYHQSGQAVIDGFYSADLYHFEFGYVLFNKFLLAFSDNEQLLLIVTSAVTVFGIGYFFYKYSDNLYLSTVLFFGLYFYIYTFTPIRQGMAVMLILWAFAYLWQEKKWQYILLVILAGTLHTTSFVFLPLVLCVPLNKRKVIILSIVGGVFTVLICLYGVTLFAQQLLGSEKYSIYLTLEAERQSNGIGAAMMKGVLCLLVAGIACSGLRKRVIGVLKEERQKALWLVMMMVLTFYVVMASYYIGFLGRIIINFYIFICLLIPMLFEKWNSFNKFLTYPVIILIIFLYLWRSLSGDFNSGIYQNVLF